MTHLCIMARISVSGIKIFWPRTHWINAVKADDCIYTTIKIDEPTVWIGLAEFLLISAPSFPICSASCWFLLVFPSTSPFNAFSTRKHASSSSLKRNIHILLLLVKVTPVYESTISRVIAYQSRLRPYLQTANYKG